MTSRHFPYVIRGVASALGEIVPLDEWVRESRIPHRHKHREHLSGADIKGILGIHSKSMDAKKFSSRDVLIDTARAALAQAKLTPSDIDICILVTCTPYELMLDQDAFAVMRELGIPQGMAPIQCGAGCGGLARAAILLSQLNAHRALVIAYNGVSPISTPDESQHLYYENGIHPFREALWASHALFSDGAAAVIFERNESDPGIALYSRDSESFGDSKGFEDPLVHYLGGGLFHPPGTSTAAELSCFGMNSPAVVHYYTTGMAINHQALLSLRPHYAEEMQRIYTHQAKPSLVQAAIEAMDLPLEKTPSNVTRLGNIAAPSTLALLHEDYTSGAVKNDQEVCFSVVGAGPERGAFITRVAIPD